MCFLVLTGVSREGTARPEEGVQASGAGPLIRQGARHARARDWRRALESFEAAVRADPVHLDAAFNAGSVARKLNRCRETLLYFRAFLFLSPGTDDDGAARRAIEACEARKGETGILTIRGEPRGAEVSLNGVLQARTPVNRLKVPVGTWQVRVSCRCPDFDDVVQEVRIEADRETEVGIDLPRKKGYGHLEIRTSPPAGVEVLLDGERVGETPVERIRLETGKHFLELRKAGFERWIRNVLIERDRVTAVEAEMEIAP
mgnify:CR=1 FL=1